MATSATLTPSASPETQDDVSRALKDRVLGAVWALASGATAETTLEELRDRVAEVSERELERALAALDKADEIVLDRTAGASKISLVPRCASDVTGDVPAPLRDRLTGAIWTLARATTRTVNLAQVRSRLADVNRYDLDRALVALSLDGEVHLDRSGEGTFVRLTSRGPFRVELIRSIKTRVSGALTVLARGTKPSACSKNASKGTSAGRDV